MLTVPTSGYRCPHTSASQLLLSARRMPSA